MLSSAVISHSVQAESEQTMAVANELLAAVEKVTSEAIHSEEEFNKSLTDIQPSNAAEQLLVYYAKGVIAYNRVQLHQTVTYLQQANALVEELPEEMKAQSPYYHFHKVLSDAYVALDNYQYGYQHKRKYLIKYAEEFDNKDKLLLASLESKYQVKQKEQLNQLLIQQNKLKQVEIKQLEQKKSVQERNTIILICIGIVFMLMIVRQLKVRQKLKWLSSTDTLTGLRNRKSLFEASNGLVREALDNHLPLGIMVIDIDHFKEINDQYGHQVGDVVLKLVAKLGQEVMRSRDVFARLGGEEFVAVLPEADIDSVNAIAMRLKDKIAQEPQQVKAHRISVTVSIGIAQLSEKVPNFDALVKSADEAMYQAKQAGRNQVVIFNSASN